MSTPGEIRISLGKSINLAQAKENGLQVRRAKVVKTVKFLKTSKFQACIERMLNLTDHLRRLRVDRYEYVAMKVIVLLSSGESTFFLIFKSY